MCARVYSAAGSKGVRHGCITE